MYIATEKNGRWAGHASRVVSLRGRGSPGDTLWQLAARCRKWLLDIMASGPQNANQGSEQSLRPTERHDGIISIAEEGWS